MPQSFTFDDSLRKYAIPRDAFLKTLDSQYDKLVVGIVIPQKDSDRTRILYVQRAATEHHYPNSYEIPGGKVDAEDETVLHAAVRETFEETGLRVVHLAGEFEALSYTTESFSADGKPVVRASLQLNFVARVEAFEPVTLNPLEHQTYTWVAEDEVEDLPSSVEMKGVMRNVFKYLRHTTM
ncbi:NUDIX hydrolase domain-like protein [Mycena albidolilacea]|uniref:NUDIX hydrolase domain-like protein n=1 Tax=Mycena albidolilacea TaxID=1033008 RepID=A0AAD6ZEW6_9AGAR|nr:NUDIX hydrolase domain-like protein [Mycena albidolilacea]